MCVREKKCQCVVKNGVAMWSYEVCLFVRVYMFTCVSVLVSL